MQYYKRVNNNSLIFAKEYDFCHKQCKKNINLLVFGLKACEVG